MTNEELTPDKLKELLNEIGIPTATLSYEEGMQVFQRLITEQAAEATRDQGVAFTKLVIAMYPTPAEAIAGFDRFLKCANEQNTLFGHQAIKQHFHSGKESLPATIEKVIQSSIVLP
jgi:hypothetical protein